MPELFLQFFGWPSGAIWGNIVAEPVIAVLTLLVLWFFRDLLMQRFVAFHHKHKNIHAAKLAAAEKPGGKQ